MKNKRVYVPYAEAKPLVNEADVLLFRGDSLYSRLLKISGDSPYTHVGVASWHNGSRREDALLECVEFHEKHGARAVNLDRYNSTDTREIDVYRPVNYRLVVNFDKETGKTFQSTVKFSGKAITHDFRRLSGMPYGWRRIWRLAKHKMAISRIFYDPADTTSDTPVEDIIYPVCSTAVAHFFSKHHYDLVMNKSDEWTEPGYIAMSPLLQYLFTLEKPLTNA